MMRLICSWPLQLDLARVRSSSVINKFTKRAEDVVVLLQAQSALKYSCIFAQFITTPEKQILATEVGIQKENWG